jgi:hypothetical protein
MYSDFEEAFIQTVDKHAPVKQRKPCQNPAPFINKELRVSMTSFKLGDAPFVKHVGSTTIFVRSNISQTSFKAVHFS